MGQSVKPLLTLTLLLFPLGLALAQPVSHPPLRPLEYPSNRALAQGPAHYVHPTAGDDAADGSEAKPWRTVRHALSQLQPGDTLYLRGGTYYETAYVSLRATKEQPITLRGYPGEHAILDGSWREFMESPATAWEPLANGEYRSARAYPNEREVLGNFGDSYIGLQTYYHAQDLRAGSELVDWPNWDDQKSTDSKHLYCGPGLWYDPATGRIHLRLSHTHLPAPVANYQGETDPRKVPLILAPFRATPLHLDGAQNLRIQDLTIRGAGYTSVFLDQTVGIEFDNVTIWAGTYGMRMHGARDLRVLHSGLYGNLAPWTFRADASKRDYPGRPHRNISRLNTHALVEIEAGRESSVYAFPQNDDWEFAYCEFTDAHDGVYLGGITAKFHHNLIENLQDDGIYLSPMYLRHKLDGRVPRIEVYQNVFRQLLTGVAFGGNEMDTGDEIFIYRNYFDLTHLVATGRPSVRQPEAATFSTGKLIGDHGSPPWPMMNIYHNTVVAKEPQRDVAMAALGSTYAKHGRRVFNNIFLHLDRFPGYVPANAAEGAVEDGNLFWSAQANAVTAESLFGKFRGGPGFAASQAIYPAGGSTNSVVADPKLGEMAALGEGSGAAGKGVALPSDWPDMVKASKPDIGAVPLGQKMEPVGRGRIF